MRLMSWNTKQVYCVFWQCEDVNTLVVIGTWVNVRVVCGTTVLLLCFYEFLSDETRYMRVPLQMMMMMMMIVVTSRQIWLNLFTQKTDHNHFLICTIAKWSGWDTQRWLCRSPTTGECAGYQVSNLGQTSSQVQNIDIIVTPRMVNCLQIF